MHIRVEAVDVRSIEAIVMIAADENFIGIRQVAEPVEEIECFLFSSCHSEIAGMYHDIGFGKVFKTMVTAVGV